LPLPCSLCCGSCCCCWSSRRGGSRSRTRASSNSNASAPATPHLAVVVTGGAGDMPVSALVLRTSPRTPDQPPVFTVVQDALQLRPVASHPAVDTAGDATRDHP
jgi:hypothetical protein